MPEAPGTTAPTTTVSPPPPPTSPPTSGGSGREGARARTKIPQFAFLVEFAGPHNENVMCPIDSHVCRGRWARKNLARTGTQIEGEFNGMPDLPGLCLLVNTSKRIVKRFDPLADEDNVKLLKRAQRIALSELKQKYAPEKPKVWRERSCDDNTLKTFCFWVLRLRDAGLVQVVKGRIPEFEEIKLLPGTIQLRQFDQLAGIVRGTPDDAIRYVKPVPSDEDENSDEQYMDEIPDPVINSDGMGFADDRDDDEE